MYVNGVLRNTGEIHNDSITVDFDENEFINGEIPDYEIVFTKDVKVVQNVLSEGTYTASIVFVGDNYVLLTKHTFQVYETSGYQSVLLIVIIIGAIILIALAIIISIRISRRKYKKALQQEQLKRINKKISENAKKKDNNSGNNNDDA